MARSACASNLSPGVRCRPADSSGGIATRTITTWRASTPSKPTSRCSKWRMAAVHHEIPTNAWSILKVSARGNRFQVYVDHRRIMQGWDNTFLTGGKVGLWTVADPVPYFDDFRINPR